MLRSAGVEHVFGNPGTTELPLLDELVGFEGLRYHLALQESVAVGMADGYAQASGRPGVLILHTTGGVANAVGLLYNAARAGTPLLVLSGQQDTRLALQEPFLYSDMVRWVRPLVKWASEVTHVEDLGRALRRALSEALAPPTGPVFVAVPLDVLRSNGAQAEDITPRLPMRVAPDAAAIAAVARAVRAARSPLIVAGDRVAHAGAEAALLALAETTGWPVALEPFPTRFIFPQDHPQAQGPLPRFAAAVRARLASHDTVLAVGLTPFEHFLYDGEHPVPATTRLVHLDLAPGYIGRNHPVVAGAFGDLGLALTTLREALGRVGRPAPPRADARGAAASPGAPEPSTPVVDAIAAVLRPDDIVVEEAISARIAVLERIPRRRPGTYFGQKGGTIGWGLPAGMGVRLARPAQRVLAVVGDGSLLMAAQGLWTAARDGLRVALIVLNNGGYGILKQGLATLGGRAAEYRVYPGVDVTGVDLVGLARALGADGERVDVTRTAAGSAVTAALRRALEAGGPYVVDAVLDEPARSRA